MINVFRPLNNLCQAPSLGHIQNSYKNIGNLQEKYHYMPHATTNKINSTFDRSMVFGVSVKTFETTYLY
jgi:hypothetical protein